MHSRFIVLILLVLTTIPAQARQVSNDEVAFSSGATDLPIRFENVTLEDGLSQSTVYSIAQDSKGFMWFGTEIGLNRYDGTRVERFMPDPFDSTSVHDTYIWEIKEDKDGYLWMSYEDGTIGRFDPNTGKSRNYYSSAVDSTKLHPSRSVFLGIDSEGRIWSSSLRGFQQLDPESGNVMHWGSHSGNGGDIGWTSSIVQEGEGDTFIITGGQGVFRFDLQAGTLTNLFDVPGGATTAVEDVHEPGVFWVGSLREGIFRLDSTDDSWRQYDVTRSDVDRAVQAVSDPNTPGIVWVGTVEGVVRMNVETGAYLTYRSGSGSGPGGGELLSNAIGTMYTDRSGILWASTGGFGVTRFDPTAMGFVKGEATPDNPNSMRGEVVWAIYPEPNGILWVAAFGSESQQPGWYLNRIDRNTGTVQFWRTQNESQPPLFKGQSGEVYFGSQRNSNIPGMGGVLVYDERQQRLVPRYTVANGMLPNDNVRDMEETAEGIHYVGTRGGIARIDPRTGNSQFWSTEEPRGVPVENDVIWRLLLDSRGTVWASLFGNLIYFPDGGITPVDFWDRADAPADPHRFLPRFLTEDASGVLWFGLSEDGAKSMILRYDPAADEATYYTHDSKDRTSWSGGSVSGIHPHPEDPDLVYFNTYGAGMSKLEVSSGRFTHYDADDGLLDPAVYTGIWDADVTLWAPTNSGLYRFDPATDTFRRFGMEYGLQSLEFNEGVLARTENNELFFGGVQGFNAFFPTQLRTNNVAPDVAITEFLLFNTKVIPGPGSPLTKSIVDTESIVLRHDQDAPSFQFAALHYKRPEANRIRYRLEPEQTEWIDAEGRNEASYTNLKPGEYTFRVIAANSDGVWNAEGASVRLTILSPWYTRWWAFLLYLALLVGLVVAVDRVQRRRVVLREREAARERELAQAREIEKQHRALEASHAELKATQSQLVEQEKLASLGSLTAGIAHEIKNPLNFVNNFAEVSSELAEELRDAVASGDTEAVSGIIEDLLQNTSQIAKHGKRADSIVRAMMQHARGGAGEKESIDVNTFVGEYVGLAWHGMRARDHGFQLEVDREFAENAGTILGQPQDLGRVLVNLLNNAFQALNAAGKADARVRVGTRRVGDHVEITVSDNGPGIPADIRSRIFEPFFTTKTTGEGTGLGLSLSYDIITKGHGGTMTVRDSAQGGAEFVITLPAA
jgi:signal transduction histidine kinase/ligand-binding sensor domain-containing protein